MLIGALINLPSRLVLVDSYISPIRILMSRMIGPAKRAKMKVTRLIIGDM
jgi:hypothetical protein